MRMRACGTMLECVSAHVVEERLVQSRNACTPCVASMNTHAYLCRHACMHALAFETLVPCTKQHAPIFLKRKESKASNHGKWERSDHCSGRKHGLELSSLDMNSCGVACPSPQPPRTSKMLECVKFDLPPTMKNFSNLRSDEPTALTKAYFGYAGARSARTRTRVRAHARSAPARTHARKRASMHGRTGAKDISFSLELHSIMHRLAVHG
eukprot:6196240-Pleurochrysis_carterae.AAC.3